MNEFPWRSLLVLALLAGMYFVCVFWGSYKSRLGSTRGDAAKKDAPVTTGTSLADPAPSAARAFSEFEFSAALAEVVAPWAHIPPVGPLRQRFESDVVRLLNKFEPAELFAMGEHGHYANPEVDAAWNGWKLALIALSMNGQLAGEEPVSPNPTSFITK